MSSLLTGADRSVAGKITRSGLLTRSSRPPASTIVASDAAITEFYGTAAALRRQLGGGPGDRLAGHAVRVEHAIPDPHEELGLLVGDVLLEEPVLQLGVDGEAPLGRLAALVGEDRVGRAAVVRRDLAPHQALLLGLGDEPGRAAAGEQERVREVRHAPAAILPVQV